MAEDSQLRLRIDDVIQTNVKTLRSKWQAHSKDSPKLFHSYCGSSAENIDRTRTETRNQG